MRRSAAIHRSPPTIEFPSHTVPLLHRVQELSLAKQRSQASVYSATGVQSGVASATAITLNKRA